MATPEIPSVPVRAGQLVPEAGTALRIKAPVRNLDGADPAPEGHEQQAIDSLAAYIHGMWQMFKNHDETTLNKQQCLRSLRTYRGEYDSSQLHEIKAFGGSTVYSHITSTKCRGATALLRDIFLGQEQTWGLAATPDPKLPGDAIGDIREMVDSEVQTMTAAGQQVDPRMVDDRVKELMDAAMRANEKNATGEAKKAEKKLQDILVEGQFYDALVDFITDLPIFPHAVIKGPVVKQVMDNKWENGQLVHKYIPRMFWYRVSPFDVYFTPGASSIDESASIEYIKVSRAELNSLIGLPGYDEDAIRAVLTDYSGGYVEARADDSERAWREGREDPWFNQSGLIDSLEWQGAVQGELLLDYGFTPEQVPDGELDYFVTAWVIGRHTIKVQISMDALQRPNYYSTSFEKIPGSIRGFGLPDILEDIQRLANGCLRALSNNMAMSCLTGDSEVYTAAGKTLTLDDLWKKKHEPNSGLRKTLLRALDLDTGELFYDRIRDIYDNGIQPVYEMTTEHGYKIKATLKHRFLDCNRQWQQLRNFAPGDLIGVNGSDTPPAELKKKMVKKDCVDCGAKLGNPWESQRCAKCAGVQHRVAKQTCRDCGADLAFSIKEKRKAERCRACASKFENSTWNQAQVAMARGNKSANEVTARGRKECREAMLDHCEFCDTVDGRMEVHHMDGDPYNNQSDNLICLCGTCHKWAHRRERYRGDGLRYRYMDYDRIVDIQYVGAAQVFDLYMASKHHNFVANGVVSKNSGPQVAIDEERLSPSTDANTIYPWKRWRFLSDPHSNTTIPAVAFFQPQSNATELLSVYKSMTDIADETSSIPRYLTGNTSVGGAGRTASGLSMLMNSAAKMMQVVAANIDRDVMRPVLERLYDMVMLTDKTGMLRGDEDIQIRGVEIARQRELERSRRMEFLSIITNPVDARIIGTNGRAEILREIATDLGMPGNKIVPSDKELEIIKQQQAQQQEQEAAMEGMGSAPKPSGSTTSTQMGNQMRKQT